MSASGTSNTIGIEKLKISDSKETKEEKKTTEDDGPDLAPPSLDDFGDEKIKLVTSDKREYEIFTNYAIGHSVMIRNAIESDKASKEVPIDVDSTTFEYIFKYMNAHKGVEPKKPVCPIKTMKPEDTFGEIMNDYNMVNEIWEKSPEADPGHALYQNVYKKASYLEMHALTHCFAAHLALRAIKRVPLAYQPFILTNRPIPDEVKEQVKKEEEDAKPKIPDALLEGKREAPKSEEKDEEKEDQEDDGEGDEDTNEQENNNGDEKSLEPVQDNNEEENNEE